MTRAGCTSLAALAVCALLAGAASAKPAHHKTAKRSTAAPAARRIAPAAIPAAAPDTTASADSNGTSDSSETTTSPGATPGTKIKTKTYTFGAMDVEGKLKTPQLLYFLNRVKLELDMSAPDKRSFMKELAQSADDKNL